MNVIYLLLTISIVVALIFFVAFIVSVRNGQYDDSYTPSVRMLFEDELVKPTSPAGREKRTDPPPGQAGNKEKTCLSAGQGKGVFKKALKIDTEIIAKINPTEKRKHRT